MSESRTGKRFPLELPIRIRQKGDTVDSGITADVSAAEMAAAAMAAALCLAEAGRHKDRNHRQDQDATECVCFAKHVCTSRVEFSALR